MPLDDTLSEPPDRLEPIRRLAIEAGRRALRNIALAREGPSVELAVGVALAAVAAIARKRSRLASTPVGCIDADLTSINARLEELYTVREKLQTAMIWTGTSDQQETIQEALRGIDSMIKDLEDILELVIIVEEAKLRIRTVLGSKTAREVEKLLAKIGVGETIGDYLDKLLVRINEEAEKDKIGILVFARLLEA